MNRAERRRQEKLKDRAGRRAPPPQVRALLESAVALHRAGQFQQAQPLYAQALSLDPDNPDALHLFGLLAYQTGRLDEAVELITLATRQDPAHATYAFNLGVVLHKQGKLEEAAAAYQRATRLNPGYPEAHCNLGNVRLEQGRPAEAAAAYDQALALKPDYVEAHNNRGAALKELGRLDEAVAAYRRALALKLDHVEAHANLGTALIDLGRLDEAVASFERALALKPDYVKAHYNLAFAYIAQGRPDLAVASLRRSADLKHNHGRPVPPQPLTRARLKHDAEQTAYLRQRGLLPAEHEAYAAALARLFQQARDAAPSHRLTVGAEDWRAIAPSFNRILHYAECPALPAGAVNPALDVAGIEARYHATGPGATYIDGLLTEEAMRSLRRFCLESTIWKRDYENGYVGAFFGDGFACPLLLQIAEELRLRFPGIFKGHPLLQAWAFKCDSEMKALNLHADAAAVNVNFWITPDEANLDPEHGGLIVWDKEAPREWNFKDYNSSANEPKVRAFLRDSGAKAITVPYRQNRAIVFNSDLFHESDAIRFRDEYESRRINVTLLYGRRGA